MSYLKKRFFELTESGAVGVLDAAGKQTGNDLLQEIHVCNIETVGFWFHNATNQV